MSEGKCYCGVELKGHKCCETCYILIGREHPQSLSEYRGHELCSHCIADWKLAEQLMKRAVTWEEFNKGLNPLVLFGKLRKNEEAELRAWLILLDEGGKRGRKVGENKNKTASGAGRPEVVQKP